MRIRLKDFFINLIYRLKPRAQLRWILVTSLWLVLIIYLAFGVYFAREIYSRHSEAPAVVFSTKIYPYPAAFVGGNIIWSKEYYKHLLYIRRFSVSTKQPAVDEKAIRAQIIDQLIENRLLVWEASKNGIRVTSRDVNDAYQKIVEQSGGEDNVRKTLNDLYAMSEKEFKQLVKEQVTKEKIQDELIAQIKVLHILVKDEKRANEVATKAKNNEDWSNLAKTYSEDIKTRDNWGNLGWIARGNLVIDNRQVPEFEDVAFKAKVGEIFGPVKSQVGFQIGKIEDKRGKINQSYSNWLDQIRKSTKIYIFIK